MQKILRCDYAYAKLTPFSYVSALHISKISSSQSNRVASYGNQIVTGILASKPSSSDDGLASVTGNAMGGYLEWYESFETYAKRSQLVIGPPVESSMPLLRLTQTIDGSHFDAVDIATATPPQEFDLPLAEGYTQNNSCKYSKDQFNVVRATFNLSKSAGTIAGGEVVATLPAGFRPKRYWGCVAIGNNIPADAATRHPVVVQVATNGEISASMMVETDQAKLRAIVCAMEFLAAD